MGGIRIGRIVGTGDERGSIVGAAPAGEMCTSEVISKQVQGVVSNVKFAVTQFNKSTSSHNNYLCENRKHRRRDSQSWQSLQTAPLVVRRGAALECA